MQSKYNEGGRPSSSKLFGRRRPLHDILGRGRVAEMVLWRRKQESAAALVAATLIWLLFEVVEYHLLTLICHASIAIMFLLFFWSTAAALLDVSPPRIPEVVLSERAFREVALMFHTNLNRYLPQLHDIARGKDLKLFIIAASFLWVVSVIGSSCSTLTLLYLGFVCTMTLPAFYEQYEEEMDHLVAKGIRDLKKVMGKVDSKLLHNIPRAGNPSVNYYINNNNKFK